MCLNNSRFDLRGKNRLVDSVPWFPRKMADLDTFAEKVLEMGEELSKSTLR